MPQAVVGLVAALGVPGLVTATGTLTVVGGLLSAGIGIGLQLGLQALFSPEKPKKPKPQDVKGVVRSSVAPRSRCYGRMRRGGALAMIETYQGDLYEVVMFCQGPIDAFEKWIIDDREVGLVEGAVTADPYNGDAIEVYSRRGTVGQGAFPALTSALPSSVWSSSHTMTNIACAALVANAVKQEDFNEIYPNRIPVLNAILRGAEVVDPRTSSRDWSSNLALCLRDYLIHDDGARLPQWLIDDTLASTAANVCDENVPKRGGGSVKRYHGGLHYDFDEEPVDVIGRFLAAMDGRIYLTPEGKIGILAGKWVTPTVTLSDTAGHILAYDLADGSDAHRTANQIVVKYTQTEALYAEATAEPWRDEVAIAAQGLQPDTVEVYEVQNHNHARRLAKIAMERANPRWTGTIRTTLFGLNCIDQRWIYVDLGDLDIDGETFEILGWSLDTTNMSVVMQVQSFNASAYSFSAAAEEGTAPAVPSDIAKQSLPTPTVSLTYEARNVSEVTTIDNDHVFRPGDGATIPDTNINEVTETTSDIQGSTLKLSVSKPPSKGLRVRAQYRKGSGPWTPFPVAEEDDGSFYGEIGPVASGSNYRARARYHSPGRTGNWAQSSVVSTS